jgi:hypothetical protein
MRLTKTNSDTSVVHQHPVLLASRAPVDDGAHRSAAVMRNESWNLILSQAARRGQSGHALYTELVTDPSDEFRRLDQSTIRNVINRRK